MALGRHVQPGSVQMSVKLSGGKLRRRAVVYDDATKTATFTPSAQLAFGTSFTA